jgi:chromosome partitioning protein
MSNLFKTLEINGEKALKIIKDQAFNAEKTKTLKTWGINDASTLIGKSRQTIIDSEEKNNVPKAKINIDTGRRFYTLEDINNLRRFYSTLPTKPKNSDACVISVANFKGGVAKTTTSVHLAQYLSLKGYKVLFVDCDSQGSGTQYFGLIPDTEVHDDQTLYQALSNNIKLEITHTTKTHWPNLDIIPANLSLYGVEFNLPIKHHQDNSFNFYNILKTNISNLKKEYDVIVIDCPPSLGMISTNALYASDGIIIPMPASVVEFSSTIQFFGMLNDILTKFGNKNYSFAKILVTKFDKTENSQTLLSVYRKIYSDYICMSFIPTSEAIKKADTNMKTIYEIDQSIVSKKTLDRVKIAFDDVNLEIENLIKKYWELNKNEI